MRGEVTPNPPTPLPVIKTAEQYHALTPGRRFIDPEGVVRIKPS
jgi:hypothetical protein